MQTRKSKRFPDTINAVIPIVSGKGGVGKSTITALLACAMKARASNIAILDIDIHGPNTPHMFDIQDQVFETKDERIIPLTSQEGIQIASVGALGYGSDIAFVWRGPMKIGLIRQLLNDVLWEDDSILLVDTPPGTGDEIMTLSEEFQRVAGCIVVTTPQEIACLDAGRSIAYAKKVELPVIGVIENFSDTDDIHLFGSGAGRALASRYSVPYLGEICVDPRLMQKSPRMVQMEQNILSTSLVDSVYHACNQI